MRIGIITYEFPPKTAFGGISTYSNNLARMLSERGEEVHVFSGTGIDDHSITIDRGFCINHLIPCKGIENFRFSVLPVFMKIMDRTPFDLIESPEVGACGLEIKKALPELPLVVKLHTPGVIITRITSSYIPAIRKLRFLIGALIRGRIDLGYWSKYDRNREADLEYQLCKLANVLTSPSNALINIISEFWQLDKNCCVKLPNPYFINENVLTEEEIERDKIILFVGKLTPLKGMYEFVKVIPGVLKKNPDYRFVFVGRDEQIPGMQYTMQQYMEKKLKPYLNNITFLGALAAEKVDAIFRRAPIAVFLSLWENYPNVILESLSHECAVIASFKGGIPEMIKHQQHGILVNPKKTREIEAAINSLILNEPLRRELAENGKKRFLKLVNQDDLYMQTMKIYQKIITL